jgi:hypothetical protein
MGRPLVLCVLVCYRTHRQKPKKDLMMKIAIVGPYGRAEKRALFDLLLTSGDAVGVRTYTSVETLFKDYRRPDFGLIVLMASVVSPNLEVLTKTLKVPVLRLKLKSKETAVQIENCVAIVELADVTDARSQRVRFALAASRRVYGKPEGQHWPIGLVPSEYLQPAPHPRR